MIYRKNKFFYTIIALAIIAVLSDVMENIQLVNIASHLDAVTFAGPLRRLMIFTWLKWGSLALALTGLSVFLVNKRWLGKIYLALSLATLVLGTMAFFNRSLITSYFTLGITMQFLLLIIFAFWMVFGGKRVPFHH